jgi:hypothetical protein
MEYDLDRVLSIAGTYAADNSKKQITAGDVAFLCDQVTDPSLSFTSETEDIVDARNNVVMVLENGRGATFGASNAFFNTQLLAAQTGGKVESAADVTFTKYDILTLSEGGVATLTVDTEAITADVYKLEKDNSLTTASKVAGTISEGKVTATGLTSGDRVLVVYTAKVAEGEHITALADGTNELMNVTAEVLLRELCNEELYYAYIIMKGKLSGEAEWGMTRDGNHAFELRCMPSYCEDPRKLVEVIIVKGEDLLSA